MKRTAVIICIFSSSNVALAQQADTMGYVLKQVVVRAYETKTGLRETPAAINIVNASDLSRFGNANILPAVNATPGVRMEERSPGSYRMSIRGSSLRSPFGVRNVKIYYNDIPFTDPGGHSYFNQLGFYNFKNLEIIKGPGSSLYGAGTGGVLLIKSSEENLHPGARVDYTTGSYNMHHAHAEGRFGGDEALNTVRFQHMQSDGYREHTGMRRDVASWDAAYHIGTKNKLDAHFLYSDLYYQTPGALTQREFDSFAKGARPPVAALPGASGASAAIYEQTMVAGFTNRYNVKETFENATTLYGAYTRLRNPTIQNYGMNFEPHFGGRTLFKHKFRIGYVLADWLLGGEFQQGFSSFKTFKNRNGNPDTLLLDDAVNNRQYFGFTQLTLKYRKLIGTAGLSLNRQRMGFSRLNNYPYAEQLREFDNGLAPRFALLYKLSGDVSIYTNIAKGFSPPTTAELLPTGGSFNSTLRAEDGWNYEVGSKGDIFKDKLSFDITAFLFRLNNTIVVRRDAGGGNYFENAGNTMQAGLESYLRYRWIEGGQSSLSRVHTWASYSYYHFRYDKFVQVTTDFSGNKLPSVAPHTITLGVDISSRQGIYLNLTYNYTDDIPLNDANTAFADSYNLLGARLGYKLNIRSKYFIDVFTGGDNLLNEQYSLGNDINGFGGRYYNVAPGVNFFAGLSLAYSQ